MTEAQDTSARNTNTSTRHVLEAMRLIAQSTTPLGLTELAEELDLPPSTAHRALMTLEESGFALRIGPSARFVVGNTVQHLIRSMVAQFPIRRAAARPMRQMSASLNATVSLNWRVGWHSMRLLSIEASHEAHQLRRVGEMRPLHDGIGPSAMLTALPDAEIDQYLKLAESHEYFGGQPVADTPFATYRDQMRKDAYLTLPSATDMMLTWISVPLRRGDDKIVASISIGFSHARQSPEEIAEGIVRAREEVANFQSFVSAKPETAISPFDTLEPEDYSLTGSKFHN